MAVIEFIDQIEKEEGKWGGRKNKIKYWTHCYLTVHSSNSTQRKEVGVLGETPADLNHNHLILTIHNCQRLKWKCFAEGHLSSRRAFHS